MEDVGVYRLGEEFNFEVRGIRSTHYIEIYLDPGLELLGQYSVPSHEHMSVPGRIEGYIIRGLRRGVYKITVHIYDERDFSLVRAETTYIKVL